MRGKEGITVWIIVPAGFETRMANVLGARKENGQPCPGKRGLFEDFVELSVTWQKFDVATHTFSL
jgi:hypothetical protein